MLFIIKIIISIILLFYYDLWTVPYPICFGIPESKIVSKVPPKTLTFAKIIPGNLKTYIYDSEATYYKGYQDAYYGFTWKKAGWDCMRHYEILANGCVPYFPNLKSSHIKTMFRLPRELITEAMQLPGVAYGTIDFTKFDQEKYDLIANKLLDYTRTHLTTRSIAQYVLDTMGYSGQGKVLFLGENIRTPDYLKTTVLIGLKEILGDKVVDYPREDYIYTDYPKNSLVLYGKGFSYAKTIVDTPIDRTNIKQRIENKEFELIIYGYVHHGRSFYKSVLQHYPAAKIAYLCSSERHKCEYAHLQNLFIREYDEA